MPAIGVGVSPFLGQQQTWERYWAQHCPELLTYIDGLVTPLSFTQRKLLGEFIITVKEGLDIDSLDEVFDVMYVLAGETIESSLRNLVKRSHDITDQGMIEHERYKGFTGDGDTGYLDTNYEPLSDAVRYLLNSASFGVYYNSNTIATNYEYQGCMSTSAEGGAANRINILRPNGDDNNYYVGLNSGIDNTGSSEKIDGMYIATRVADDDMKLYVNKVAKITSSDISTAIPNQNIYISALHSASGASSYEENDQMSFAFAGRGLSEAEITTITDAFQTYMDASKPAIPETMVGGLCLSLDDTTHSATWVSADDVMSKYGWKATFLINTPTTNETNQEDIDFILLFKDNLDDLVASGHELANHTIRHRDINSYTTAAQREEYYNDFIVPLQTIMTDELGVTPSSFGYPAFFGPYPEASALFLSEGFGTIRENTADYPSNISSICYNGQSQVVTSLDIAPYTGVTLTDAQIIALLRYARDNNLILNILSHRVTDTMEQVATVLTERMRMICRFIVDNNMTFYRMDELRPALFGL